MVWFSCVLETTSKQWVITISGDSSSANLIMDTLVFSDSCQDPSAVLLLNVDSIPSLMEATFRLMLVCRYAYI